MSQEIENIVKQTFENFEADVNPQVWTNIQQGLQITPPASTEPAHVATVAKTAGIAGKLSAILTVSSIAVITAFVTWYYSGDPQPDKQLNEPSTVVSTPSQTDLNTNAKVQPELTKAADQPANKTDVATEPLTANKNTNIKAEKPLQQPAETVHSNTGSTTDQIQGHTSATTSSEATPNMNVVNSNGNTAKVAPASTKENTAAAEAKDLIEKFNEQPKAFILANPVVGNAPLTVNFLNNGYAKSVKWNFGDGTSMQQEQTTHIFETPGKYEVTLTATDENNRVFTDKVTIDVKGDENINLSSVAEIQNVFTPNGDGYNDVFMVHGKNLASLHGEIYNIAGKRVFKWSNPEDGWDGTLSNGASASEDAYFYIIEVTGKDGQEYHFKGSVRLIK